MLQNRWGGSLPNAATRFEYSVSNSWLSQYGIRTTAQVLEHLGSILFRLSDFESRPFFAITAGPVDRKNKHQSRVEIHPEWRRLVQTFRDRVIEPVEPLRPIDRGLINGKKACSSVIGFLTSAAAHAGVMLTGCKDLLEFLGRLLKLNEVSDEDIAAKWQKKAERAGTLKEPTEFHFGANVAESGDAS